jgi:hypothetical protein
VHLWVCESDLEIWIFYVSGSWAFFGNIYILYMPFPHIKIPSLKNM